MKDEGEKGENAKFSKGTFYGSLLDAGNIFSKYCSIFLNSLN